MLIYSITTNTFGEPRLFGVYESAQAAALAFEHLTKCADPGDEYRLEYEPVRTAKEEKESLANCRRARLERIAEQEAVDKVEV